jgi:hypothetical protein
LDFLDAGVSWLFFSTTFSLYIFYQYPLLIIQLQIMDELLGLSKDAHHPPTSSSAINFAAAPATQRFTHPGISDVSTTTDTSMVVDSAAKGAPFVVQIMDFSPTQDHQQGGGTKVLLITNVIPPELQRQTIYVSR